MSHGKQKRKKILIIRPSALGDTLLLAPALYQLAHKVKLTVVGRRPGIDFLRPLIEEWLDYERGTWHTMFSPKPNCSGHPASGFERVICFLTDPDGAASRGLRTCFHHTPVHCFNPFPSREQNIHVAYYVARCLNESGLPLNPDRAVEEAKRTPVLGTSTRGRSNSLIVLHPGSGSETKNYPLEFWFNLVHEIGIKLPYKKIVLLGPAERKQYQRFEQERWDSKTEFIRCPEKEELHSLLHEASVYVGHDSGITHLSALLGTPTIALFKNSHRNQWAPLGPDVTVIAPSSDYHTILEKITEKVTGTFGAPDTQPKVSIVNRPVME
jgi:ADP-heptose:LPS heptosyltransferase